MPEYKILPDSEQLRFQNSRVKVQLFGGGFGNGKTAALCIKALRLSKYYPGCNGLLARSTYPKLNDTLRREFFKWCPPSWVKRKPTREDNTCILINGSTINFRYVQQRGKSSEDGTTTSNLLSATYDFIGVDQCEDPEITYKDFLDFLGRLRGTTPYRVDGNEYDETFPVTGPRFLMLTCNPTHNWIYKKLVMPYKAYERGGHVSDDLLIGPDGKLMLEVIESPTQANSHNLPDDFIEGMTIGFNEQMRKRFVEGKWGAFEGLVYPDYDANLHMIKHATMMDLIYDLRKQGNVLETIEGYDFGIASPSCYLFGVVDHLGRVFLFDGFYRSEFELGDQCAKMKSIQGEYAKIAKQTLPINADPDIFKRKVVAGYKSTGRSIANIMQVDHGLRLRPADNNISAGIAKVTSYIRGKKGIPHPCLTQTGPEKQTPMIYFSDRLSWVDEEFLNYFWQTNPFGHRKDKPIDKDDHAMDTIKYILSRRLDPSKIEIPFAQQVPEFMLWQEQQDEHEYA